MTATEELSNKSFEELVEMLEETIQKLDGDSLTLEESISAYERSVAIASACEAILDSAELRISQIDVRKPADPGTDDEADIPF